MSRIPVVAGAPQTVSATAQDQKVITAQGGTVLYSNTDGSGSLSAGSSVTFENNTTLTVASGRAYAVVVDVPGGPDSISEASLPTSVETATVIVKAGSTSSTIAAQFAALVENQRLVFEEGSYTASESWVIPADGIQIDASRAQITQTAYEILFDAGEHDRVRIDFTGGVSYDDPDGRWTWERDYSVANFRGERASVKCSAVWSSGSKCKFIGESTGFYCGVFLSPWSITDGALRAEGEYAYGNRVELVFDEQDFGVVCAGQYGLKYEIEGRYSTVLGQYNPPHALYATSTRGNRNLRGSGHAYDSNGTGHSFQLLRGGTVSGGSFTLTVQVDAETAQTTAAIPWDATGAQLTAAVEALSNVPAGGVQGAQFTGSGFWLLTFAHSLGEITSVSRTSSLTGSAPTLTVSEYQPFDSGGAWRFKETVGGTFASLSADDCPGLCEVYENSSDLHFGTMQSTRDRATGGGSVTTDTTVARCTWDSVDIELVAGQDERIINLSGTDMEMTARIAVDEDVEISDSYCWVRGTRNTLNLDMVNAGSGGRRAAAIVSGTGNKLNLGRVDNAGDYAAQVVASSVDSVVQFDPALISGCRPLTNGDASTIIKRRWHRKTTTISGAGTTSLDANEGTEHVLNVTTGSAFTLQPFSPSASAVAGDQMVVEVQNNSGGAMGSVTWTNFTTYLTTMPATGTKTRLIFVYNGTSWVQETGNVLVVPPGDAQYLRSAANAIGDSVKTQYAGRVSVGYDGTFGGLVLGDAGNVRGTRLDGSKVTFMGGRLRKVTLPGAYPYTVLASDDIVRVVTTLARAITIPAAIAGTEFLIVDETGSAGTNNITLSRSGSDQFFVKGAAAATSYVMDENYEAAILVAISGGYKVIPA